MNTKTSFIIGIGACAALALAISCATVDSVVVAPPMIAGAKYVGMDTCGTCHEKAVKNFKLTQHARIQIPGDEKRVPGQGCEGCHGPGSLHVDAGGGRGRFIVNPGKNPEACFQCHIDKQAEFSLAFHHPVKEGRMTCITCHDPHGENIRKPKILSVARVNEVCAQCHHEQTRPHVFDHQAVREGCTTCHNIHGSINPKMLTQRDNTLCLKCHAQLAVPGQTAKTIIIGDPTNSSYDHTSRLQQATCFSAGCHTAVHGSNINNHFRY